MPLIGILGTGGGIAGALAFLFGNSTVRPGGAIAFLVCAPIGLLCLAAWINGYPFLVADLPAGKLHFLSSKTDRISVPFAELGELVIDERAVKTRTVAYFYDLRAATFPGKVLFTAYKREAVEERRKLLEDLVAQSAVRAVLASVGSSTTAFRDGPDVVFRVRQVVKDPARLGAAVAALGSDPDSAISAKARELISALESNAAA